MPTFFPFAVPQKDLPSWWDGELPPGHEVELEVYGDRMSGRLLDTEADTIRIMVPAAEQSAGLLLTTSHGTATISVGGGAVRVPVSCWASGDAIRLQVIGAVQFIQRRMHKRVTLRLPVNLTWLLPGDRAWGHISAHTVDLSLGGLQIAPTTTVWPSSGSTVRVELQLPTGPCSTTAEVVGTTPDYGLRLVFTALGPAATEQLRRLTT